MKIKRFMAIARLNLLIQLRDPIPTILMTIIPLMLTPFLIPSSKTLLISEGYASATGAEQVVPGMAVLFSFLSVQFIVQSFLAEHPAPVDRSNTGRYHHGENGSHLSDPGCAAYCSAGCGKPPVWLPPQREHSSACHSGTYILCSPHRLRSSAVPVDPVRKHSTSPGKPCRDADGRDRRRYRLDFRVPRLGPAGVKNIPLTQSIRSAWIRQA